MVIIKTRSQAGQQFTVQFGDCRESRYVCVRSGAVFFVFLSRAFLPRCTCAGAQYESYFDVGTRKKPSLLIKFMKKKNNIRYHQNVSKRVRYVLTAHKKADKCRNFYRNRRSENSLLWQTPFHLLPCLNFLIRVNNREQICAFCNQSKSYK